MHTADLEDIDMPRSPLATGDPTAPATELEPETANDPGDLPRSETPRTQRIADRAYQRFQRRGGEHGRDLEDWFEAERELSELEFKD
jgi:hypothetical protein